MRVLYTESICSVSQASTFLTQFVQFNHFALDNNGWVNIIPLPKTQKTSSTSYLITLTHTIS